MPSGRITDWNHERGFGFVDSEGSRIFLHWRDFTKRYKAPEVGDVVRFELGKDKQGRVCAQKAVHVNEGGRFTSENAFLLLLLLGAPICAIVRLSRTVPPLYLAGYWIVLSVIAYCVYAWDKSRAGEKKRREPERFLHLLELIGGWPGAFVAQRRLRHKCSKFSFQLVFWLIVAMYQFIAIDYLRDWSVAHRVSHGIETLFKAD